MIARTERRSSSSVPLSRERDWATSFMHRHGSTLTERPTLSLSFVAAHVAVAQGLSFEQMRSNRHYQCVRAKHLAIYLARKCTTESLNTIARTFGLSRGGMARVLDSTERRIAENAELSDRVTALQQLIFESWTDYVATLHAASLEREA